MAGEAIFIGYRRDDTADVAGRIYDAMAQRFGRQRIFKDVDNIPPGVDFGDYIKTVLPRCRVALVLIGPHWLDSKDESGKRRIDDAHDWVRIEIETALATPDLLVVPVLVNGARMPRGDEVPDSLGPLMRRNAAIIRRDPDFHDDVERLAAAIRASVNTGILDLSKIGGKAGAPAPRARERKSFAPLLLGGAVVGALVVALLLSQPWLRLSPRGEEAGGGANPNVEVTDANDAAPTTEASMGGGETAAQAFQDCADVCPEMVRIPGQSFAAGKYEVTFAQWDACVAGGGCEYWPYDVWGRGNRPVIEVSWDDAQSYVRWLSQHTGQRYRLLTSAEWEIAARAGTTTNFSWGDQNPVCDQNARNGANFWICNEHRTRPVGSFRPNAFGLYDVHGNVGEWVEDCSDSTCSDRVIRGGSWASGSESHSIVRHRDPPSHRDVNLGFRVARTL